MFEQQRGFLETESRRVGLDQPDILVSEIGAAGRQDPNPVVSGERPDQVVIKNLHTPDMAGVQMRGNE